MERAVNPHASPGRFLTYVFMRATGLPPLAEDLSGWSGVFRSAWPLGPAPAGPFFHAFGRPRGNVDPLWRGEKEMALPTLIAESPKPAGQDPALCAAAPAGGKTVRVLHLINGEYYAGAERVQDLLALRLGEHGFEVGFACVKPAKFAAMREARAAPIYDVSMRSKWDLRPAVALAQIIRREGYSLLHTHTPRTALLGRPTAFLARVPMVHHMHGQTSTEINRRFGSRMNAVAERLCLVGASAVIACSASAGAYACRQGLPERLVRVVTNGIAARGPLPERTVPQGEWTLGTVALFRPRKGLEALLEAVAGLRSQGLAVRLRAVGPFETESYRREVLERAARLDLQAAVEWPGFTRDVPAELARMDLFVFPSLLAEGLPMVLLEAMAAGVPIVASRVDGVTDVVHDPSVGMLVPPGDSAALAEAIARFVRGEMDWAAIRSAAHCLQTRQFSDRSMAAGVAEVYREVLAL